MNPHTWIPNTKENPAWKYNGSIISIHPNLYYLPWTLKEEQPKEREMLDHLWQTELWFPEIKV